MAVTVVKKAANLLRGIDDNDTILNKVNFRNNCDLFGNNRGVLFSVVSADEIACSNNYPADNFNYVGALDPTKWVNVINATANGSQCVLGAGGSFQWFHTLMCPKTLVIDVDIDAFNGDGSVTISVARGCRTANVSISLVSDIGPPFDEHYTVSAAVSGVGSDTDNRDNMGFSSTLTLTLSDTQIKGEYTDGVNTITAIDNFAASVWNGYPYFDSIQFLGGSVGGIRIDDIS